MCAMRFEKWEAVICLMTGISLCAVAGAFNLNDLVRQTPQLYLPSQILPGHQAVFTVKGKPGNQVTLILSGDTGDKVLPSGAHLHLGTTTVSEKAVIPASGVVEIPVAIPNDRNELGDVQYVEAVISSGPDQADGQPAQILDSNGHLATQNTVAVGTPPDKGHTLVIPGGDPTTTNLLRSVTTMYDVGNDPRKQQLLYDGDINRDRPLDQNLNMPTNP